jgi:hypothetical protein
LKLRESADQGSKQAQVDKQKEREAPNVPPAPKFTSLLVFFVMR